MGLTKVFRRLVKLIILGLFPQMLLAQTNIHRVSTGDGVYTADQAQLGKTIYQNECGMCHGNTLEGAGVNPPLAGGEFLKNWTNRTVADLFMKTITMMPAMNPGSMTPQETAQVLAYILSVNNFPAGKTDLSSNFQTLNAIYIDNRKESSK
jgi:S-disulfanyl-L-cysteine oxidoreductase SoxD